MVARFQHRPRPQPGTVREVSRRPGALHRFWWVTSEPFRLLIRLSSERWLCNTRWQLIATTLRLLSHILVGNLWWFAGFVAWMWIGPSKLVLGLVVAVLLGLETGLAIYRVANGRPHSLTLWRSAWRFHRQWPRIWTDCAAKTREVQGLDNARGGESRAAALRPVVDHPRMPWRFWFRWPVITFRVGVAPGRTFVQFERVTAAIAANMPWIHAIELDYDTDRDSFALLHVALDDVLVNSGRPNWVTGFQTDESDTPPRLRVIEGGEGEAA